MNPYDRLRRTRGVRLAVVTAVVAAFVGIVAGPASAATGCTYNAATQTVAFTLDDDGILTVGTGADNGKILWDNDTSLPASQGQCAAATTTTPSSPPSRPTSTAGTATRASTPSTAPPSG